MHYPSKPLPPKKQRREKNSLSSRRKHILQGPGPCAQRSRVRQGSYLFPRSRNTSPFAESLNFPQTSPLQGCWGPSHISILWPQPAPLRPQAVGSTVREASDLQTWNLKNGSCLPTSRWWATWPSAIFDRSRLSGKLDSGDSSLLSRVSTYDETSHSHP